MGCFVSFLRRCFGIPDDSPRSRSSQENLLDHEQNEPSVIFLSEENPSTPVIDNSDEELDLSELKDESEALKSPGPYFKTPTEIQNMVGQQNELLSQKGAIGSLKSEAWLTSNSIAKLDLKSQPDHPPMLVTHGEEWMDKISSAQHAPFRFSPNFTEGNDIQNPVHTKLLSNVDNSPTNSSASTGDMSLSMLRKSVRFNFEPEIPSLPSNNPSETLSQTSSDSGSDVYSSYRKPSPYPTPVKVSAEMQTPGTIFPAYMDETDRGKHPWIRPQYVQSITHPAEVMSQWKMLDDKSLQFDLLSNDISEPISKVDDYGNASTGENSGGEEFNLDPSLSPWLRVQPSNQDASIVGDDHVSVASESFHAKTPSDRPILGMVHAHLNADEPLSIPPNLWDVNGIPNTTNKYKEDQKVKWHATPFEERLEKALSADGSITRRRQSRDRTSL